MAYDDQRLDAIFARTHGHCHLCGKRLSRGNYAAFGSRGAWEVEHSVARAKGGHAHHLNNLYAACITCNRSKGAMSTRTVRGYHGRKRAPLALKAKQQRREDNAVKGALIGAAGTALLGVTGPAVLLVTAASALIGHRLEPDPQKGVRRR